MKSNYQGSDLHRENARKSITKANSLKLQCEYCEEIIPKNSYKRHAKTCMKNPKNILYCKNCNKQLLERRKIFCNSSYSAKFNNKNKIRNSNTETNSKISNSLSLYNQKVKSGEIKKKEKIDKIPKFCKLIETQCSGCNKIFLQRSYKNRKTCSGYCQTHASRNKNSSGFGSLKITKYFNKHENKTICLQSSWELEIAKFLDKIDIKWTRPLPIKWLDKNNKQRLYYPDFYLPDHNLYLDPKNNYCMKLDEYKMQQVSKKISIIYGYKEKIIIYLHLLKMVGNDSAALSSSACKTDVLLLN